MFLKTRAAIALVVSFLLLASGSIAVGQDGPWGPGPVVLKQKKGVWAQTYSDIAADPAVKFGTLPNGMRYAIMKNATPPGQASLRLRFDAGSMMEKDDQQGLAHFLEHMAFNGSKGVPEGEMIKILERLGMAFGADTNASTGHAETTYQLDLPRTDDETVDTSLKLFRETASELLIQATAVDKERGVVLSEERSRDGPDYRVFKENMTFLFGDHVVSRRMPIGTVEVLRNAPPARIADFYRAYYRPERAVLIAVGDFDVNRIEEKIKARFSDWKVEGSAGPEAPLTLPVKRGLEVKLIVEQGIQPLIYVNWILPPDLDTDSKKERTEDFTESLGYAVLNRRLARLARAADPPFIGAQAYAQDLFNSATLTGIDLTAQPGQWRAALDAVILEQRRAVQFGVTKAEIDLEIEGTRTALKESVARAATRRTPGLADELVRTLEGAEVLTSPAQDLALFEEAVKTIDAAKVSAALKASFNGSGPLVFIAGPTAIPGGEAAVRAALNESLAKPVTQGAAVVAKTWPYTNFGAPGRVAEERTVELGDKKPASFIRFANGVRLTVKPTDFRDNQILVSTRVGTGLLRAPTDKPNPSWTLPTAFIEGGLKDLTAEDIEIIFNNKVADATLGVGEEAVQLNGATRPEDLLIQMQLMAAYVTAPGWRPEPLARMKASAATIHDQFEAVASGVFGRDRSGLTHSGDKRFTFPSREEIAGVTLADVRALLDPQLANGQIEVVIVGDVTVEAAKQAVAATFGALPPRPAAATGINPTRFPAPNTTPVVLTHKGRADQAIGFVAWKTDDYFADVHKGRTLRVVGAVMELRLIEELRENQGKTYSPQTDFQASSVFQDYGYGAVLIETPPENLDGFFRDVEKIVADLRDKPVTQDELDRAKKPAIESMQRRLVTNEMWLTQLSGAQSDPRRVESVRTAISGIERITAADVQAAAKEYLRPENSWKLVVKAEGAK